jgi:hypothetical protein
MSIYQSLRVNALRKKRVHRILKIPKPEDPKSRNRSCLLADRRHVSIDQRFWGKSLREFQLRVETLEARRVRYPK